jgi:hypothetical protein
VTWIDPPSRAAAALGAGGGLGGVLAADVAFFATAFAATLVYFVTRAMI